MKTLSDPVALDKLVERLEALRPEASAIWGSLTAGEMLCHLADATASVLEADDSEDPPKRQRFLKWLALSSPVAWPRGLPTSPDADPHQQGTKPSDFAADRDRAIRTLRDLAAAPAESMILHHGAFGPMSARDWHRWAYRHADHHLKQFGL